MSTLNYIVNVAVNGSDQMARLSLTTDRLNSQLSDLSKRVATPTVDLNDKNAALGIAEASVKLDRLSAKVAKPDISVQGMAVAERDILRVDAMLDRLGDKTAHVSLLSRLGRILSEGTPGIAERALGGIGRHLRDRGGAAGGIGRGLGNIGNAAGGTGRLISGASSGIPVIGNVLGALPPEAQIALYAGAVATAVSLIAFAAQAAAGALTFGLGAALTGIAILGASKSKAVKESFSNLTTTVNKSLTEIGRPFIPVLGVILRGAQTLVQAMTPVFTAAAKIMAGPFQQFATVLEKAFAQPAVKTSIEAVATAFAKLLTALKPQIPGDVKDIAKGITAIADAVAKNPGAFAAFVTFLVDVATFALNAIAWLTKVATYIEQHFRPALQDISKMWDQVRHDTANQWDQIYQHTIGVVIRLVHDVETQWNSFQHETAVIYDGVRHEIAAVWDGIWSDTIGKVIRGVQDVQGWFKRLPGMILAALTGVGTAMYNEGHLMLTELWNGIKSVAGSIFNWAKNFVGSAVGNLGLIGIFTKLLHIGSPSAVFYDIGRNMMLGLEGGIKASAHRAASAAAAAGHGAIGAMPGGGSEAANAALARRMYPPWGSGAEWNAWNYVAMAESGWNQFARNPSGAYGIPQALPASKMGAAANPPQSNPGAQIAWMISYIKATYGDPIRAAAHEQAFSWYGSGLRNGIFNRPTLIGVGERGPERVNVEPLNRTRSSGPLVNVQNMVVQDATDVKKVASELSFRIVTSSFG